VRVRLGEQSAWEWIGLVHERLKQYPEAAKCFECSHEALARVEDEPVKRGLVRCYR